MISLLIFGPKQPRNDIDVFLEPFVEELKVAWDEGVRTYDAHSSSSFNMKVILMWVIHDFLAYGNMVGCTTKGFCACPIYGKNIDSMYLKYSRKCVYMGHRRYIPINHKYRSQKDHLMGILSISLHLQLYKCQIFLQKHKEGKRNGESLKVQKEREILKKVKIQRLTCGRKGQFYSIYHIGRYVDMLT